MEWIHRSAIRILRQEFLLSSIGSGFVREGILVKLKRMGALKVLVTFCNKDDMDTILWFYGDLFELWFQFLHPYNYNVFETGACGWIKLSDVPIHLWNYDFFKSVVDQWGCFIISNKSTINRESFEGDFILVEVAKYS